jgi:PhnB protein
MSQSTPKNAGFAPAARPVSTVGLYEQPAKTMAQINPYLTFNGNCREAMTFYKECLGGNLELQTVKGSPMEDQFPSLHRNQILHASLTNNELVLLGSDRLGSDRLVNGNTIALSLKCNNEEEINTYFTNLSDGGRVVHPLHQFFAGTMGTITDKFGRDWLLYCEKKKNRS